MPDAASFDRTDAVMHQLDELANRSPASTRTFGVSGLRRSSAEHQSTPARCIVTLQAISRSTRGTIAPKRSSRGMRSRAGGHGGSVVVVDPPPPVRGIGTAGGFKLMQFARTAATGPPGARAGRERMMGAHQDAALPASSRSTTQRHRSSSFDFDRTKANMPACLRPTSSRRFRSISARPTSMTSTFSAAPTT